MKRSLVLTCAALLIAGAVACKNKTVEISPTVASSDEALFKEGERFISRDPERARLYFRQVIDSFPRSFYAQRAKLAIGDTYFAAKDEGSLILAASEYREFISLYPYSPSAPLAQLRTGLCFFNKALKPGRDQSKTEQALAEFRKTIAVYPLSEEAKEARERIKDCEERLAEHTYLIGRHYHRVKSYRAAVSRLTDLLTNYPLFSGMDKVYYILADSYFLWDKPEEARPFFIKLVTDYPNSKWVKKAQSRLKEIEAIKASAPPPAPVKK